MFYGCNSLVSLPDITKWNIFDIFIDINNMIKGCYSLLFLPKLPNNLYYAFQITYNINEKNKDKLRIFGNIFVKNNKDQCKIIYKDKKYELK